MRRRDHEEIVRAKDKLIEYLKQQNSDLLDRLMYLSGSTWTPPPPSLDEADLPEVEHYSFAPEQEFDSARD